MITTLKITRFRTFVAHRRLKVLRIRRMSERRSTRRDGQVERNELTKLSKTQMEYTLELTYAFHCIAQDTNMIEFLSFKKLEWELGSGGVERGERLLVVDG